MTSPHHLKSNHFSSQDPEEAVTSTSPLQPITSMMILEIDVFHHIKQLIIVQIETDQENIKDSNIMN